MKNDFEALNEMARTDQDIKMCTSDNLKRATTGKNGWGEVVLAVDNSTILNLDKYYFGLYFANKTQFDIQKRSA